jgi:hypothetical protein
MTCAIGCVFGALGLVLMIVCLRLALRDLGSW